MSDLKTNDEKGKEITNEELNDALRKLGQGDGAALIGENDEFEFECQQCGSCCMHRSDIILNPFDIYNAAKYLGISCRDFLEQYTTRTLGGQSHVPMVLLKSNEEDGFCPFLKFDYMDGGKFKCTINPAKPGACRSHPIGLMSQCDIGEDGTLNSAKVNFIKVAQCPQSHTGKMQKVSDWMQYYLDHQEETFKAHELTIVTDAIINWREFFFMTAVFSAASQKNGVLPHDEMFTQSFSMFANILIEFTYAQYDTNKPFLEQCEANGKFLHEKFTEMSKDLLPAMRTVFASCCKMTVKEAMKMADEKGFSITIAKLGLEGCSYDGVSMSEGLEGHNDEESEAPNGEDNS